MEPVTPKVPNAPNSPTTPGTTAAAIKYDTGKARYDLIPPEALEGLARLYGLGGEKYDDRNWEKSMAWGRIYRAMLSHATKWHGRQDYDEEDGQHHILSVIWCAMALYTYQVRGIGEDDRPFPCPVHCWEDLWKQLPKKNTKPLRE